MTGRKIYAVDFDGTLAETDFPKIIKANTSMFILCKQLKRQGSILILWTCRCGKDLEEAVEFCRRYGLEFNYINENVPENIEKWGNDSRKIFAHEYIDDRAWSPVRERIWQKRLDHARWCATSYGTYIAIALLSIEIILLILRHFSLF